MQIINLGYIKVSSEFESLFITILDAAGFEDAEDNVSVYEASATVEINEDGDIERKLNKVVDAFTALDISIDVNVNYYGDYEGRYIVSDGDLVDLDKTEVAIMDSSDNDLIKELENRGYTVTKENNNKLNKRR